MNHIEAEALQAKGQQFIAKLDRLQTQDFTYGELLINLKMLLEKGSWPTHGDDDRKITEKFDDNDAWIVHVLIGDIIVNRFLHDTVRASDMRVEFVRGFLGVPTRMEVN